MDEIIRSVERTILGAICKEISMPPPITELLDALVKNGCPLKAVLEGMGEYAERLKKREEKEELKELLKGLPIKLDEED